MNSVRRLMVASFLTIGTLGLGVPTTFAASLSNWQRCPDGPCTSFTPDQKSGDTKYYPTGKRYQINNRKVDGSPVAAYFYRWDHKNLTIVDFKVCPQAGSTDCQGELPKDAKGEICMETGARNDKGNGTMVDDYQYGDSWCFIVNS